MAGEKTEKATPKRKEDERKKGNIFQSQDLTAIAALFASFYALKFLGPYILQQIQISIHTYVNKAADPRIFQVSDINGIFVDATKTFFICAIPMLLVAIMVNSVITMAQTRMLVSTQSFKFKMSHLNPVNGFKKMFSSRGVVELLKASAKAVVILYLAYKKFEEYMPRFAMLMDTGPEAAITLVAEFVLSLINMAGAIFIVLAGADYIYQWWQYEKNLRMSKQEIKEEYKHTEGDPQVKGQIRQRQRKQAMGRMMQNVPKADVIIRNPTHYAIAIEYNADKNRAPMVLAKGADYVAQRIVQIASDNHITMVENPPLARGLYAEVDIDREIPVEYYGPVAEVLAFVYSLREKGKKY